MKKYIYSFVCCIAAILAACDDVDRLEDRFIPLPQVEAKRKVLLEEFTGQRCVNCPTAHLMINDLKTQYGENFIPVGIHATSAFGLSEEASPLGLMNSEGDAYAKHWNANALPCGIIDRTSGLLDYDKWAAYIRTEMEKEPKLNIEVTAEMDTLSSDLDSLIRIEVKLLPLTGVTGKLQLWITESEIYAPQVDGSNYIMDYQHNHVFRACVNGAWGTDMTLQPNIYTASEYSYKIKKHWNRKKLSVVAFLYNNNEGVLQAEECDVTFETTENN